MNTMTAKMCGTESLETQDKLHSHVLTSDNFMAKCSYYEKTQSIV